uniref:Thromboxane A synthase 1 n=1 Tax=Pelodiscus sinensis TaxID=13735 RepID=K7G9Q4_PELSI
MELADLLTFAFMEINGTTVTVALLVILLVLLSWYSTSAFSRLQRVGIRHPTPLPFIGNLLFFQQGFWENHTKLIKDYGPVSGYYMGRRMYVLVSEPEMIKHILVKDFSNFTNRMTTAMVTRPMVDSILCLRDQRWKDVRSMLTPAFSAAKMKEVRCSKCHCSNIKQLMFCLLQA